MRISMPSRSRNIRSAQTTALFASGDTVELVGPDCRPFSMTVPELTDEAGEPLSEVRTPQMVFHMKLPRFVPADTLVRHAVELSAK